MVFSYPLLNLEDNLKQVGDMAVIMLKSSAYPAPTRQLPVLKATTEQDRCIVRTAHCTRER
ncbi:hypothetical protein BDFB_001822 [Asbolus verrucosus]|uniref:Uncharacterized protein n=1 Tax=Asbolus verrucosus TaxID=1661398 RepID=A0A482VBI2_ASBVE|nr:hypothetical protein BDFB_001822 [Asbolus verrucosus]